MEKKYSFQMQLTESRHETLKRLAKENNVRKTDIINLWLDSLKNKSISIKKKVEVEMDLSDKK